jgi:hypothetical protein
VAEREARGKADRLLGEVTQERNRADLARQAADRRATEAREVVDFLINDLIGAAGPSRAQGKIPTVDQVLAQADRSITKRFSDRPLIEASIRDALGQAFQELGQYQKAEQHAAWAVELRLAHLGPAAPETIAAQNALGWALHRKEEDGNARALMTPVLATAREALGREHPVTLRTMHVLAAVQDEPDQARALSEELVAIQTRVLGPEHPSTLAAMNNLAGDWSVLGEKGKARLM